jgi:hypothetical protein
VDQLTEYSWSHCCHSTLITRGSAGRAQLVTLLSLYTHHPWISWQTTAGHTSVTLHLSPVDQLEEHSRSHFYYSPLITRGSAGRAQLVTPLLLSTHNPWIRWQSTSGHNSVTLHSSPMDQLAEHSWSHFCYYPLITRGSAGRAQLVTLLLLSTHHPWISWQSTAGQTSVTLHSSSVGELAEHSWSHFGYFSLTSRGSAGRAQLITLRLQSTHYPRVSCKRTAAHTSVTFHSSPAVQLVEYSWSHCCYSSTSSVDQLEKHSWSHFCYSPHHQPWISWQSTAGHNSVTLNSSPVDQLAEHSWSHLCYSPFITCGSAGRVQLVTLLSLYTHHAWISWQSTAVHTSVTFHSSPAVHLAEYSWSHFCYSSIITRRSAGKEQLVTLLLLSTHQPWISWQSTAGHNSVTLLSSPEDQLAEYS